MGNQHSASHAGHKPRKNVHWKSAGPPAAPGKPEIEPVPTEHEPDAVTLRWSASSHDGGAPLLGYQVECARVGGAGAGAGWLRTAPPRVLRPELVLTGLEPPHRYQFRVAAVNVVGLSAYSELSDVLHVGAPDHASAHEPPFFLQHLEDVTALENEKTEFRVGFAGSPSPTVAWFKDGYEIFSSRRTAITTTDTSSVLVFHQTLASDEGEVKCTATNRAGHAVTKARLELEAAPKLRYPRQYEDGLLYEINETIFLKISIVGKPTPTVEWLHDGQPIAQDERVETTHTGKLSMLKIATARRSDRGEYAVLARNSIGEDSAAFLVTVTAPPDPPRRLALTRQLDKSLALEWDPPEDDGGCRIGNYVIEYFRTGWNVWLKATTSRKTSVTLFDLIEGSEYRFRVKAESPYGMSAPSVESAPVRIPGRTVDLEFLAVESRIIAEALVKEDGEGAPVSPVPRRRRAHTAPTPAPPPAPARARAPTAAAAAPPPDHKADNDEFMLVLYPNSQDTSEDKAEKRKSFQLELEDALSPPPLSLSAPELSSRCTLPFKALRNACSSTELLHERAMARFYKAVAMREEYDNRQREKPKPQPQPRNDIPRDEPSTIVVNHSVTSYKAPEIIIKSDSVEDRGYVDNSRQASRDSQPSDNKWSVSFDEDYTASTVSTDEEYSDDASLDGDERHAYSNEEETYHPRNKPVRPSPVKEALEEEEPERELIKPLPLPDPSFVPKPILKRRESDVAVEPPKVMEEIRKPEPKKEEKMTIFKKITKMPKQKIPFPKILNKKGPEKPPEKEKQETSEVINKLNAIEDKIEDEGRTVIDYYSNIVKEYGGQKKPAATLYLNTEDLKSVAEKQQQDKKNKIIAKTKKPAATATKTASKAGNNILLPAKPKAVNSKQKKAKPVEKQTSVDKPKPDKKAPGTKSQEKEEKAPEKYMQQIVLKTAERATIVIPIDYQELEVRAKENVRTAIDYMVDVCLLLLAFWVYLFKDERLAIPFLVLIIYRQCESLLLTVPAWLADHTPDWLKKKTS